MTTADVLVVASIRRWVADDFAPACATAGLPLLHSWGLDVPDLSAFTAPAWWTTTEHATRLRAVQVPLPVLATGPRWLATVPEDLTGRPVWAGPLADIAAAPASGWAKPAEAKAENLPAAWWDDTADFALAATAAGLPPTAWVQISPRRLDIVEEHRAFVHQGAVATTSPYLLADGTTWHDGLSTGREADATAFAHHAVTTLGANQPPAYVLDVARTRDDQWVVLEGNPAWSSALYGCDPHQVLQTVLAANDVTNAHPRWRWEPDPYLLDRAARARPLPRR